MRILQSSLLGLLAVVALIGGARAADSPLPVISVSNPALSAAGAGDSSQPKLTPDGRYVVFTSSDGNLTTNVVEHTSLETPLPLNVYRYDRVSGTIVLVSVSPDQGRGGNEDSWAAGISTNGQFVLFESRASNLVAGDTNGAADVFIRDLEKGLTVCVSRNQDGIIGNGSSRDAVMTPDARYVAFTSSATNLVAGDENGLADVFRWDQQTGELTLVSAGAVVSSSSQGGDSGQPRMTPDGRYVAFLSSANGLVPGVTNSMEVFVSDTESGVTLCPSFDPANSHTYCYSHLISTDGRFITYQVIPSGAPRSTLYHFDSVTGTSTVIGSNLFTVTASTIGFRYAELVDMSADGLFVSFVARPATTDGVASTNVQVYRWDAQTETTSLVSGALDGSESPGAVSMWPRISPDGRYILFYTSATNLVAEQTSPGCHLYERDMQEAKTWLVDIGASGGATDKDVLSPAVLSADGRYVAFDSTDSDLVPGDHNNVADVFLRDVTAQATVCASRPLVEVSSSTVASMNLGAMFAVNQDGTRVAFTAGQRAFFEGSTNDYRQAFVRDMPSGQNILASPNLSGLADAVRNCMSPSISADGRKVVFSSVATNLVAIDTNAYEDVFLRDLDAGQTVLVSLSRDGKSAGNGNSYSPQLSASGHQVLFWSRASNLAGSSAGLLLRDLDLGTNYAIAGSAAFRASMTPDGQYVAFSTSSGALSVWSTALQANVFTTNTVILRALAISPAGSRVAGVTAAGVLLVDRALVTTQWLGGASSILLSPRCTAQFSADGQRLVFSTPASLTTEDTNTVPDVYVYDYSDGKVALISRPLTGDPVGNGASDSPVISADGRFIAFRSSASNLVSGDGNGVPDVFLYDTQTHELLRVSAGYRSQEDADDRSLAPAFSGDGGSLLFLSAASNLSTNDLNRGLDLFSLKIGGGGPSLLFSGQILYRPASTPSPIITWPVAEGRSYHVEYKDDLSDPQWILLSTPIQVNGGLASATDPTPHPAHRFYRIVAQ